MQARGATTHRTVRTTERTIDFGNLMKTCLLALGFVISSCAPLSAQETATDLRRDPPDAEPGFVRLVLPATAGAAVGSSALYFAISELADESGDATLGYALLGGLAGGALGAGTGMWLAGDRAPWGPAAAGVLAGIAGVVITNAVFDLDTAGVFIGFSAGEGIAAALLAALAD